MTPSALLRLLGRHARWMLPAGVCIGLVLPWLAQAMRSWVTPAVIGLMTAALLRLDWTQLKQTLAKPALPLRIAAWQLVASPIAVWVLARTGLIPEAYTVLTVLQAASAPIGSAAAFALFLGIPGHLCMAATVVMTLLLPLSLTAVVTLLLPSFGVQVELASFFARVVLSALAPFAIAALVRRLLGDAKLRAIDGELAGVNVVLMVLFGIAVMNGVTAAFIERPGFILGLVAWSWLAAALWHAAGFALLRGMGSNEAMSASLMLGNRNLGLTLVATAGTAGDAFQMYTGLAQIPLFCAPLLLSQFRRPAS